MSTLNRRKKVGLVLGGGVVRGLAHIGVLSVLEEEGIPIDFVAGTSAGSMIGAAYSAGLPLERIRQIGLKIQWWHLLRPVWPREGLVSFEPLRRRLEQEIGELEFKDLVRPFAAVTADLDSGDPVPICSGRVALAVQASCSVPGFVTPVRIGNRILGDGSLVDTVPVSVLREMGADYVIGVDIFASAIRPRWGAFGMGFTALEILVRRAGSGVTQADCLIVPELYRMTYMRFSKRMEIIERGAQAARAVISRIKRDLGLDESS